MEKINLEIINDLFVKARNIGYWIDDDHFFFTSDGFYGYIIPKKEIFFDVSKVTILEKQIFDQKDFIIDDHEIRSTKILINFTRNGYVQKFIGRSGDKSWKTYIDKAYLKAISGDVTFYQMFKNGNPSGVTPILVVEDVPDKRDKETGAMIYKKVPRMLIMPKMIYFDEEEMPSW